MLLIISKYQGRIQRLLKSAKVWLSFTLWKKDLDQAVKYNVNTTVPEVAEFFKIHRITIKR